METIKFCRVCGNESLIPFFDLGSQPLANSLPKTVDEKENFYPLSLSWCPGCNLVQLNQTIDPKELFSQYVWVTATSKIAKDYAETFYQELAKRSPNNGYVLEIASNDGTFLKPFMKNGYKVLGVDPAENIAEMAKADGVPTDCYFFGEESANKILIEHGSANIIFARNVLPHVANTRDFVRGLSLCLSKNGTLAIEVHYAKEILKGLHYDSIYHEHLCYFTLKSLERLLNDFNLYVFDIGKSPISGGSMVVYAKLGKTEEEPIVQQYRDQEKQDKINGLQEWEEFSQKADKHRNDLLEVIKKQKGVVAGYGSSARSSTMLNFAGINSNIISFIADANPLKQGRFAAGTRIPIISPEEMIKRNPNAVVILAWNFADEITDILRNKLGYKGRIIIPLPQIKENDFFSEGIEGIKIMPLKKISDDRGTIMHGVRSDNILNNFGEVYFKKLYKGVINGWHVHEKLVLNYICLQGMIKLVLCDLRENSPTYKKIQEIYIGDDNYCLVHIPTGVANAMTVIGENNALICNVASEPHDPSIKYKRIDHHSGEIPYDWNKKDR
jgi:dTDP-4-dehydrorhamnose 3,5-epimerase-like enzyme